MVGYELLHKEANVAVYRYLVENRSDDAGIISFDLDAGDYTVIEKAPSDSVGCYGTKLISAVLGYLNWPLHEKGTIVWY